MIDEYGAVFSIARRAYQHFVLSLVRQDRCNVLCALGIQLLGKLGDREGGLDRLGVNVDCQQRPQRRRDV